jgi:hypothetical protein
MTKRAFTELQVVELTEDVAEDEGTVARGTVGTIARQASGSISCRGFR